MHGIAAMDRQSRGAERPVRLDDRRDHGGVQHDPGGHDRERRDGEAGQGTEYRAHRVTTSRCIGASKASNSFCVW